VATHGRSFWVLDSVTPLRQLSSDAVNESAHLFAPGVAMRTRLGHKIPRSAAIGENPFDGAYIYYWLKEVPKEPAKLEFLDAQGKTIRKFTSEVKKAEEKEEFDRDPEVLQIPAKAGLNRFVWDLRYEPPVKIPAAIYDNGEPAGPLALPGNFQARLTVGGKSQTVPLQIKMDPRVETSAEDLRKQFDLLLKIRDREDELNRAVLEIRDLGQQMKALEKRLGTSDESKSVVASSAELRKKITAIEEALIQVNATSQEDEANYPTKLNSKMGYLTGVTDSADTAPTEAERAVFAKLDQELETELANWRELKSKDLMALNESMRKANVPLVAPAASKAD
jgi:hypothetical protein